jgi:hypothetical protein
MNATMTTRAAREARPTPNQADHLCPTRRPRGGAVTRQPVAPPATPPAIDRLDASAASELFGQFLFGIGFDIAVAE